MAKFGTSKNEIVLVSSNGSDKVFIYDSAEVLTLWNPYTDDVVARTIIQRVKCVEYVAEDNLVFVLSHNGGQL